MAGDAARAMDDLGGPVPAEFLQGAGVAGVHPRIRLAGRLVELAVIHNHVKRAVEVAKVAVMAGDGDFDRSWPGRR